MTTNETTVYVCHENIYSSSYHETCQIRIFTIENHTFLPWKYIPGTYSVLVYSSAYEPWQINRDRPASEIPPSERDPGPPRTPWRPRQLLRWTQGQVFAGTPAARRPPSPSPGYRTVEEGRGEEQDGKRSTNELQNEHTAAAATYAWWSPTQRPIESIHSINFRYSLLLRRLQSADAPCRRSEAVKMFTATTAMHRLQQ